MDRSIFHPLFTVVLVAVAVHGEHTLTLRPGGDSLRIIILGDFGGMPLFPYYTYAQRRVAKQVGRLAESERVHAFIELGDNFYYTGVSNSDDSRFAETFENVYQDNSWEYKPWYIIAGNHDHFGNVTAQIEYSQKSRRWTFPSLYYMTKYELDDGLQVDIIFIDTVVLCGNTRDIGPESNVNTLQMLVAKKYEQPPGPRNVTQAEMQWQWIERSMRQSTADYLLVAGHYPLYSISSHGPTNRLVDRLRPLMHKYNASAYLSGHDHNLQHLKERLDKGAGGHVHYVLSGAASRADGDTSHAGAVPPRSSQFIYPKKSWNPFRQLGFTTGGFAYMRAAAARAQFTFYSGDGDAVYQFAVDRRTAL